MIKSIRFPDWTLPLALLAILIAGFGVLIPWLGFYWDDWPSIWFLHIFGPTGFIDVLASDRPFLSLIFMITTTFLRESIVGWQIFGLLSRWLAGIAFWWTLRLLWPQKSRQAGWIAILFTIYPGFSQQSISVTYSNAWIILAAFIASLGLMLNAIRNRRLFWWWMGLSLLCSAFAMYSTEYFFTLELLRPVLCWIVLSEDIPQIRERFKRTLLYWLPFLLLILAFLIWRFYIHEFPRAGVIEPGRILSDPISAGGQLVRTVLEDIVEGGILAWYLPVRHFLTANFAATSYIASLVVAVLAALAGTAYLAFFHPPTNTQDGITTSQSRNWAFQAILLGLFSLLIAGWPFWLTDLLIKLEFPNDRFTMSMMIGSSLLLVGLLELIPKAFYIKITLLGLLIGLAVGQQFNYANMYRLDWNAQKDFFRQLSWRSPAIKPGTVVMAARLPFKYFSDNSLTAPLNWIYAPDQTSEEMPYLIYDIQSRRGNNPKKIAKGEPIYQPYRATSFTGNTSQALVLVYSPPGCLKVLDPLKDENNPVIPWPTRKALHLSDLSNIQLYASPATLPQHIFGAEPAQSWCYYFQKAELARQTGDWQRVAELGDQAFQLNQLLYPVNGPELVTYFEGYAYTDQWKEAKELILKANRLEMNINPMLCDSWQRITDQTAATGPNNPAFAELSNLLKCPEP